MLWAVSHKFSLFGLEMPPASERGLRVGEGGASLAVDAQRPVYREHCDFAGTQRSVSGAQSSRRLLGGILLLLGGQHLLTALTSSDPACPGSLGKRDNRRGCQGANSKPTCHKHSLTKA